MPPQAAPVLSTGNSIKLKEQGDVYLGQGNLEAAANCYRQAIAIDPNYAKAHSNLGFVFMQQGATADAEESLKRALSIDNTNADTYFMLGNLATLARGDLEQGCRYLQKAVELSADLEVAYLDWARYMKFQGKLEQVKQFLISGLEKHPSRADYHRHLGNIYQDELQFDLAANCFQRALSIYPDDADALANLGFILYKQGQSQQAHATYEKVFSCLKTATINAPNDTDLHFKLANFLTSQNRYKEAIDGYERVLTLNPEYGEARLGRGMALLVTGQFESGWEDIKDSVKYAALPPTEMPEPVWLNDADVHGKTILLHADQGLGDTIHFVRYAEQVNSLGATVYIRAQASLKSLLMTLPGVSRVFGDEEILPPFDYQCSLSNISLAFNTTLASIPAKVPYLQASADRTAYWSNEFSDFSKAKIGIVWSGNPLLRNDKYRSIHLQRLSELLITGDHHFFLLQKEIRSVDAPFLSDLKNVTDLRSHLVDFSETAAVIANLDLVITVDTSVAHLAGALGKPVWIMLPFSPDFRWLLDRNDSPWYPTARLFRQSEIGDWDSVIKDLKRALDLEFM
ncbi:tetratricopeptide repeat protein [Undibacterium hunanense]|uniref:tetratricopeptide repeat protein n=1 Tax=Undibacterium hunanense TaxID=2762292 RepID=UPI001C9B6A48|nr:tetratricopeptide repeat protein [Undibacterium hunanense]